MYTIICLVTGLNVFIFTLSLPNYSSFDVAVLGSPSLIVLMPVSVDVKQH